MITKYQFHFQCEGVIVRDGDKAVCGRCKAYGQYWFMAGHYAAIFLRRFNEIDARNEISLVPPIDWNDIAASLLSSTYLEQSPE